MIQGNALLVLLLLPFAGSIAAALLPTGRNAEAWLAGGIAVAGLIASLLLYPWIASGGIVRHDIPWLPSFGLSLTIRVDGFAWLFLMLIYAIGQPGAERNHVGFQSLYLIMAAGVGASFIVGDLFTLFVAFEVMLTASYVLITRRTTATRIRAGMTYVTVSLMSSLLFLTAVALVYAATGTVNLADLATKVGELPPGVQTVLGMMLLVVFGIKAAIVPLHFWLPDSYPNAPAPVAALFAGLLTKVSFYALLRTQTLIFTRDEPWTLMLVLGYVAAGLAIALAAAGSGGLSPF